MRDNRPQSPLPDVLLFPFLVAACFFATRLESLVEPGVVPFAQVVVFASVALLLTASARRRGLALGSRLAYIDELTRLSNRRAFTDRLTADLADYGGIGETPGLLLLDLDRFKLVNDTMGHPAGDELLKVVAERLRASVPASAFVARLGGDEFAAIVKVRHGREAVLIAEDVLAGLNQMVTVKGQQVWPNASIGVALAEDRKTHFGELLRMADVALYQAKGRGRGRAFLYDSNARLPTVDKLSIVSELHLAVRQGQFEMRYQPIVNLSDRRIVAAEALLRWNHPNRGVLGPDAFLAMAQESGMGRSLAQWVVEEVGEQARVWRELFGDRLAVSMSLSPADLQTFDLAASLSRLIEGDGVPRGGLSLEVAESSLAVSDPRILAKLTQLRQLGFKVAIDDFGLGQSSLNYLQTSGADFLKLASVFVQSEAEGERARRVIHSIVDLAHSLDMTVVAEGIETAEQYRRMLAAGCEQGQGSYFTAPITAQKLTDLLADDLATLPSSTAARGERRGGQRPWARNPGTGPSSWDQGHVDSQRKKPA